MDYIGPEIISELKKTKNGTFVRKQKILVKCSLCDTKRLIEYEGHAVNCLKRINTDSNSMYRCRSCIASETLTHHNKSHSGKTLEEIYGVDKANTIKQKLHIAAKENNHPLFLNPPHPKWDHDSPLKGKSYEEILGSEKNAETRKDKMRGANNPQFGLPARQGSGNGWSGWYNNVYFRSLLELSYIVNHLEKNNIIWESAEQKRFAIPYQNDKGLIQHYFADFKQQNILVEVKPKKLLQSPKIIAKQIAAMLWCSQNNLQYLIVTDKEIQILTFNEIKILVENGSVKWLPKYQKKYEQKYCNTN